MLLLSSVLYFSSSSYVTLLKVGEEITVTHSKPVNNDMELHSIFFPAFLLFFDFF
uniref:Uncharacterized protein n=1 Tax=Utricularia reniformis TaxID=192314 RepID=A0A1Y0B1R8_9LAMI|nr:hypothetical protein AEK19_MT1112 [Utricularia reniformis]ART31331.1 hypothetical protein AEK19_MT1112 [Utricularia reniformis]